jgi:hypothetical protein
MGYFIIAHLYVGITDEAGLGHRRIFVGKLSKPCLIKGEDVVIKDKHLYPFVTLEQLLYLSQYVVDAVSTYVVFREMAGLAIEPDDLMVQTVRAPERTPPSGKKAHPSILGIDHLLKIEDIIVFKGKGAEIGVGTKGFQNDFVFFLVTHVSHALGIAFLHQFQKGLLSFADTDAVRDFT